jgi:hypothetical protein
MKHLVASLTSWRPDHISQKQDGNEGGLKKITTKNGRARQRSGFKDSRFTFLGFTAANDEPVMGAVVLSAQTPLKAMEIWGCNATAQLEDEEPIELENIKDKFKHGANKKFPFGPKCTYKVKVVDCWVVYTEHGSIASELLADMLQKIDSYKLFDDDWANGVRPVLLLDGHGSRFEVPFLRYTMSKKHKWYHCIGTPWGSGFWQVGESEEQNGSGKIALKSGKKNLLDKKRDLGLMLAIEKHDIMTLVNWAWAWYKSFARVECNKKAICDRGWSPLNRYLLDHP